MAIRGPQYSTPKVAIADFHAANERGLIVSMHQSGGKPGSVWEDVYAAGVLGSRTNIVHGASLPVDWVKRLVEVGASFTTTPENELGQGHCIPIIGQLLRLGAAPSLGTDADSIVSGEILIAARIALAVQRGLDHEGHRNANGGMFSSKPTVTSKQALSWATMEGARALGLADRVGRIDMGMQADLTIIDARMLNLWPALDPLAAALHASIANIEAVMVAGKWRKRDHTLVYADLENVKQRLWESGSRLVQESRKTGLFAGLRRGVVRQVVHHKLKRQMRT
jgi:cytosine/adenosine deaminase-related metal-dependent hydrolase